VAGKFLNGTDVVTGVEEVRGERMAECMAGRMLGHTGFPAGDLHRLLHDGFIQWKKMKRLTQWQYASSVRRL